MTKLAAIATTIVAVLMVIAFTATAHAKPATWPTTGDRTRTVVTMWGTVKRVDCRQFHWLATHGDLDPHTPRLRGDIACGRRPK